jgi:microcompartment protein CcmL/EutN
VEAGARAAKSVGTVNSEVIIARPSEKLTPKLPLEPMAAGVK